MVRCFRGLVTAPNTVAAAGPFTGVEAGIFIDGITIVTGFESGVSHRPVLTEDAVTATGQLTVRCTSVAVDLVAIVTGFAFFDEAVELTGLRTGKAAPLVACRVRSTVGALRAGEAPRGDGGQRIRTCGSEEAKAEKYLLDHGSGRPVIRRGLSTSPSGS